MMDDAASQIGTEKKRDDSTSHVRCRGVDVQEDGDEAYIAQLLKQCWPPADDKTQEVAQVATRAEIANPLPLVNVQIVEVARPVPMSTKDVATWLMASVELTDWLMARVREAPHTPLFQSHAAFLADAAHRAGYLALPLVAATASRAADPCGGESALPVSTTPT